MAEATRPDHALETRLKKRAASISVAYNITLTLLKLAAAVLTGSVSLLSEAVHSATDVVASGIALVSVRAASAPPDEEHPYGHGKIESLAGFGESILLLLIVCYVAFESIQRLFRGGDIQNLNIGIWIMGFSAVTSFIVSKHVKGIAERTGSLALKSNSQHLMVDSITSIGVLGALIVTKLTGWEEADPAFALALTIWMAFGAYRICKQAFDQLIDRSLTEQELAEIKRLVESQQGVISHHRLRTRLSGNTRYIELHVVVPTDWTLVQAHDTADELEKKIVQALIPAVAVIHVDPFDPAKVAGKTMPNME